MTCGKDLGPLGGTQYDHIDRLGFHGIERNAQIVNQLLAQRVYFPVIEGDGADGILRLRQNRAHRNMLSPGRALQEHSRFGKDEKM